MDKSTKIWMRPVDFGRFFVYNSNMGTVKVSEELEAQILSVVSKNWEQLCAGKKLMDEIEKGERSGLSDITTEQLRKRLGLVK